MKKQTTLQKQIVLSHKNALVSAIGQVCAECQKLYTWKNVCVKGSTDCFSALVRVWALTQIAHNSFSHQQCAYGFETLVEWEPYFPTFC